MSALDEHRDDELGLEVAQVLHEQSGPAPSPDLFARVVESIDADRHRRRHAYRIVSAWAAGVALATTAIAVLCPRSTEGDVQMPWWILQLTTTAILIGIALWLGPFIKRFGRAYAADVFHDNPLTGKSYIVLTDVVYYLIFAAYILFTVRFEPPDDLSRITGLVTTDAVHQALARIGGILLIIGVLHGLNIVLMPVLGRLFSLNRRLPDRVASRLGAPRTTAETLEVRVAQLEREADDGPGG